MILQSRVLRVVYIYYIHSCCYDDKVHLAPVMAHALLRAGPGRGPSEATNRSYTYFELRCKLSFSVAWEGEQLADMSTAVCNSAPCPHVFAHKHISLPPLSGFYCANSRTTEAPNGPTPFTPPNNSSEINIQRDMNLRLSPKKISKISTYSLSHMLRYGLERPVIIRIEIIWMVSYDKVDVVYLG